MKETVTFICILFLLLSNYLTVEMKGALFYIYLAIIYIDCKNQNLKGLVLLLSFIELIFYDLNQFITFVSTKLFVIGPIALDLILNIVILINMVTLIFAIFYRCEIFELFTRKFNIKQSMYLPTRSDVLLIKSIKLITVLYMTIFIVDAMSVCDFSTTIYLEIQKQLNVHDYSFIELKEIISYVKYFIILLVLKPWQESDQTHNSINC